MKNWDCSKNEYVETSKKLKCFFKDIENVCKKHGYSISHEDGHGAFEIEKYSDDNIDWLKNANLRLNGVVRRSEQLKPAPANMEECDLCGQINELGYDECKGCGF